MADDAPYKVVVEALAAQSAAIARLAKEVKTEFAQYEDAVASRNTARANKIAAAINERTAKLVAATEALAASVPDAEVGGGPATPPSTPDQGLPGDQPGVGGGPARPSRPTDPDFGIDQGGRPVAPDQPPSRPDRPDQGLPPGGIVGGGPVTPPNRPGQGLPPGGEIDAGLPDEGTPTLDYLAPSTAKVGQSITFDVHGDGFSAEAKASIDGEEAGETIYVNVNLVRVKETFGSAGAKQVTVNGSEPLTITVS